MLGNIVSRLAGHVITLQGLPYLIMGAAMVANWLVVRGVVHGRTNRQTSRRDEKP